MTREVYFLHYTGHKTSFSLSYNEEKKCWPIAEENAIDLSNTCIPFCQRTESASLTAPRLLQAIHGRVI